MGPVSLWDDLSSLFEILFRLGARLAVLAISCAFLYQAYQAGRSALFGINTAGSAPVPNPQSLSSRLWAVLWTLFTLTISIGGFVAIFGIDIPSIVLRAWSR
jgi:hypothetical protein